MASRDKGILYDDNNNVYNVSNVYNVNNYNDDDKNNNDNNGNYDNDSGFHVSCKSNIFVKAVVKRCFKVSLMA